AIRAARVASCRAMPSQAGGPLVPRADNGDEGAAEACPMIRGNASRVEIVQRTMSRILPGIFALLWPAAIVAQNAPSTIRVIVPVVGSVVGANNVRWKTDIALTNDTRESLFIALQLP